MQPGETVSRSALDKPLHQLTEDDISQLTREDCRRYLKEKGMRRPSWNKSQAIQQVISLKTLLETTPETESPRRRLYIPPPDNPPPEELVPSRQPDPPNPAVPPPPVRVAATVNDSVSPRDLSEVMKIKLQGAAKESAGQMTIFYCGKVNVYDNVPRDKAQVMMHLAAKTPGVKAIPNSAVVIFPNLPTVKGTDDVQLLQEESNLAREDNLEGSTSRKASFTKIFREEERQVKEQDKGGSDFC
ncbi:hypothetical protein OIU84_013602 [Salix udensis]|uniref:Protein TIFY n=1 Tax=Salix udensis TaxID=889485 RepID=A0AAD6NUQ8_9ROSI|nr:hypothetical protein OIU84_013602 [Salix udensis]